METIRSLKMDTRVKPAYDELTSETWYPLLPNKAHRGKIATLG
jgi:hypothetical protein